MRAWRQGSWKRIGVGLLVIALGAAGGAALVERWWGATGGGLLSIGAAAWIAGRPTTAQRRQAHRVAADLPFAIDMIASALRSGSPPDKATLLVAEAVAGPVGDRLTAVSRALHLGIPPAQAWAQLAPSAGTSARTAPGDDGALRVARAAQRSGHSGAALASALTRVADDLRADAVLAAEAQARTAGVLVVLPLGLCFLPAFVLAGLAPVVVAVIGDMFVRTP
jgi:Flp pilus assembly protein TadB